ncbi:MAG TPA: protein-L-isoD(D-D) O-methyltransferase, partial [Archangium sp.]
AATTTFDFMRRFAVHEPLSVETIDEARRVARRWVVVKGGRYGGELKRLGLKEVRLSKTSPTVWGRVGPSPH